MRKFTTKQMEILQIIATGRPDGGFCDWDDIAAALSYVTTKASLHFSIRALVKHGMVEKKAPEVRNDRRKTTIGMTEYGAAVFRPAGTPPPVRSIIETEDDVLVEEITWE